jgi:hypothetical protein
MAITHQRCLASHRDKRDRMLVVAGVFIVTGDLFDWLV